MDVGAVASGDVHSVAIAVNMMSSAVEREAPSRNVGSSSNSAANADTGQTQQLQQQPGMPPRGRPRGQTGQSVASIMLNRHADEQYAGRPYADSRDYPQNANMATSAMQDPGVNRQQSIASSHVRHRTPMPAPQGYVRRPVSVVNNEEIIAAEARAAVAAAEAGVGSGIAPTAGGSAGPGAASGLHSYSQTVESTNVIRSALAAAGRRFSGGSSVGPPGTASIGGGRIASPAGTAGAAAGAYSGIRPATGLTASGTIPPPSVQIGGSAMTGGLGALGLGMGAGGSGNSAPTGFPMRRGMSNRFDITAATASGAVGLASRTVTEAGTVVPSAGAGATAAGQQQQQPPGKGPANAATAASAVPETGATTVEDHVAARVKGAQRRKATKRLAGRICASVADFLLNWQVMLAALIAAVGIVFYLHFPSLAFWENPVYRWAWLISSIIIVIFPLRLMEWGLFYVLEGLAVTQWLQEVLDFASSGKGHLANIAVVIMALLLKYIAFELQFGTDGEYYFDRTCIALIVIEAGVIICNVILKIVLRRLYEVKHSKAVADVIFYEEVSRCLTAPLPPDVDRFDDGEFAALANEIAYRKQLNADIDASANNGFGPHDNQGGSGNGGGRGSGGIGGMFVQAALAALPGGAMLVDLDDHNHRNNNGGAMGGVGGMNRGGGGGGAHYGDQSTPGMLSGQPVHGSRVGRYGGNGNNAGDFRDNVEELDVEEIELPGQLADGDGDMIRRSLTPTHMLDVEGFWQQAGYVRDSPFTSYDPEGYCVWVETNDGIEELAKHAYDKLFRRKLGRLARRKKVLRDMAMKYENSAAAGQLSGRGSGSGAKRHTLSGFIAGGGGIVNTAVVDPLKQVRALVKELPSLFASDGNRGRGVPDEAYNLDAQAAGGNNGNFDRSYQDGPADSAAPAASEAQATAGPAARSSPLASQSNAAAPSQLQQQQPRLSDRFPTRGSNRPDASRGAAAAAGPGMSRGDTVALDDELGGVLSEGGDSDFDDVDFHEYQYDSPAAGDDDQSTGLVKSDVMACFTSQSDLDAAWRLLDLDANGVITKSEFVSCFALMFTGWTSTQTALQSYGGISNAIRMLADSIYWIAMFLIVLAIFGVDFSKVIVPLGTIIISLGFAVGPSIQRLLDCLMFVLVIQPFDVGDRVAISGVASGATHVVNQINVLTSELTDVSSGKRVLVRNSDIAGMVITNHRRSPDACFGPKFVVDHGVTGEQLKELEQRVKGYLRAHQMDWKPSLSLSVEHSEANKVVLTFWVTSHASWQESGKIWGAHSKLVVAIVQIMKEMGLEYQQPTAKMQIQAAKPPPGPDQIVDGAAGDASGSGKHSRRSSKASSTHSAGGVVDVASSAAQQAASLVRQLTGFNLLQDEQPSKSSSSSAVSAPQPPATLPQPQYYGQPQRSNTIPEVDNEEEEDMAENVIISSETPFYGHTASNDRLTTSASARGLRRRRTGSGGAADHEAITAPPPTAGTGPAAGSSAASSASQTDQIAHTGTQRFSGSAAGPSDAASSSTISSSGIAGIGGRRRSSGGSSGGSAGSGAGHDAHSAAATASTGAAAMPSAGSSGTKDVGAVRAPSGTAPASR